MFLDDCSIPVTVSTFGIIRCCFRTGFEMLLDYFSSFHLTFRCFQCTAFLLIIT